MHDLTKKNALNLKSEASELFSFETESDLIKILDYAEKQEKNLQVIGSGLHRWYLGHTLPTGRSLAIVHSDVPPAYNVLTLLGGTSLESIFLCPASALSIKSLDDMLWSLAGYSQAAWTTRKWLDSLLWGCLVATFANQQIITSMLWGYLCYAITSM